MTTVSLVLQFISFLLLVEGVAAFWALVKGWTVVRRLGRGTVEIDTNILLKSPLLPGVSLIAVPPDVSPETREFIWLLLNLHFGKSEVVLVLDGPSPTQLETWVKEFRLALSARAGSTELATAPVRAIYESCDPLNLVVIDKEPGGEADAYNAGVNQASSPVIGILEPQSDFEPTILLHLIRPMLETRETSAIIGFSPLPLAPGWPARLGALESVRLWLVRWGAFSTWDKLIPLPGSAMLVKREEVVKAGGFHAGPTELFLDLHGRAQAAGKPSRISLVAGRTSRSRVPSSWAELHAIIRQDQHAIARTIRKSRTFSGGLAAIGWGVPGLVATRLFRPLLETAAYLLAAVSWALGWVDAAVVGFLMSATVGVGIVTSMAAAVLQELADPAGVDPQRLRSLFLAAVPENLGYRQLRNLWLIAGFFS